MNILLIIVTSIALVAIGYGLYSGPSASKSLDRRLRAVRERHSKSSDVVTQVQFRKFAAGHQTGIDNLFQKLIPRPALLKLRLKKTGKSWTLTQYTSTSLGLVLVIFIFGLLQGAGVFLLISLSIGIGLGIPHMMVNRLIKKRYAAFSLKFADAIDLMVRGLRSGLPISETMGIVASEIPGPVGFEFKGIMDKMKMGRTMEAALQETADRLNMPEFQFYVITLAIQRETGGNLAETLNNLGGVLRKRVAMRLKIRAMSSEAKASAYIIGALPFIVFGMITFVNFDYMKNFFIDERLIVTGLGGMAWMSIGAFIMSRMISFEI